MRKLLTLILCCFVSSIYAQHPTVFMSFDINPGGAYSNPHELYSYNNKLYFAATSDTFGCELWVSDGTTAGTKMLKDIWPGPGDGNPNGFIEMNGQLYFTATNYYLGPELWTTDGTSAGTHIVADVFSGMPGSNPGKNITVLNGKFIFAGRDYYMGTELWISDGTDTGTKQIKDIRTGFNGSNPANLTTYNGKVYFTATDSLHGIELWVTDGTKDGTVMLKDIFPGVLQSSDPQWLYVCNGLLMFTAIDGAGREPWVTDGTVGGTKMIKDIWPGSNSGINATYYKSVAAYNGRLYFSASEGTKGQELWATDGTSAGTVQVKDIYPLNISSSVNNFCVYDNNLYMSANEPVTGTELWKSDGTATGTVLVKDIDTGKTKDVLGIWQIDHSNPRTMTVYKKFMYFIASDSSPVNMLRWQLYETDGTTAGTNPLFPPGNVNRNALEQTTEFCMSDSVLYFAANYNGIGNELWAIKDTTTYPSAITRVYSEQQAFAIFPNPSNGVFTLQFNKEFRQGIISIYDVTGKLVMLSNIRSPKSEVSMNTPKGIYIVKTILDGEIYTKRIAIE